MEPKGNKNKSIHWLPLHGESTNNKEVLALALVTCWAAPKAGPLQAWASDVVRLAREAGGELPRGPEWAMAKSVPGAMLKPIHDALNRGWPDAGSRGRQQSGDA